MAKYWSTMLELPYCASCRIANKDYTNLPVIKMNDHSVHVVMPNGDIVKRNIVRHNVTILFVSTEI